MDRETLRCLTDCIDNAHHFGATCVAGFTGRLRGKPLTDSLPRYREVWSELAQDYELTDQSVDTEDLDTALRRPGTKSSFVVTTSDAELVDLLSNSRPTDDGTDESIASCTFPRPPGGRDVSGRGAA
jgi:hypothetical protein